MYAFLNTNGEVLGVSYAERTIVEAQLKNLDVTTIIVGAPDNLVAKSLCDDINVNYHKKVSGNGTNINDYILLNNLDFLKIAIATEIDLKTQELISQGYEWPVNSGQYFSTSEAAQRNWTGLRADIDQLVFPIKVPIMPLDGGLTTINTIVDYKNMYKTGREFVQNHIGYGQYLKNNTDVIPDNSLNGGIKNASTVESLEIFRQANEARV